MNDHLNIEQSRRLHELGAFTGRAFEVGDWVVCTVRDDDGECDNGPWLIDAPDCIERWSSAGVVTLQPRLGDLLGELESVCGHKPSFYIAEGTNRVLCQVHRESEWFTGKDDSYLIACYECLVAVLEARKGGS